MVHLGGGGLVIDKRRERWGGSGGSGHEGK